MRGLRLRLTVGGIALAVLAVGLTAWITARTTTADLVGDVDATLEAQTVVLSELTTFAVFNGSWVGVSPLVNDLADGLGIRIALTDLEGGLIADSEPSGDLPALAAAVIDPANPAFSNELSEQAVQEAGLISAHVSECLTRAGIDHVIDVDEFGLPLVFVTDEAGAATFDIETGCYDQAFEELEDVSFDSFSFESFAEPALLFFGTGPTPAVDSTALVVTAIIVAFVLIIAATIFADRITRPIHALMSATRAVRQGDLGHRVDVTDGTEVGELADAFNKMTGELESARDRRRQFTTDVAHELRTPLANITGHVEAMIDGVEPPSGEVLSVVRGEVYRLGGLVDDLQQLALADEHALTLDTIPLVLEDVVDQVVLAHRRTSDAAGIRLEGKGAAPEPLELDARRIRQALDNLVVNAIRHTPPDGRVTVSLDQSSERTTITVADSGPGIPEEFLPRLFDRFSRADRSRSRTTGGTGLGLSIAKELVEAHGGTIEAANSATGATFTITLPSQPRSS